MSLPISEWKHKGGTSDRKCTCGTWKEHWLNFSKKSWPSFCSVAFCSNAAEVGAHVTNQNSDKEWIVPTCKVCNAKSTQETFDLSGSVTLVPANQAETCAK
ncbi:hypothetical protein [Desulfovibrio cuneatus]|uniref:hypothetical protein n=1 Tax=Desulfovibrio cuneatus TaxID=159728 RepID=UPI0012EC703F|nr:hypothetical protein [Desulfovibrio cuneatus]